MVAENALRGSLGRRQGGLEGRQSGCCPGRRGTAIKCETYGIPPLADAVGGRNNGMPRQIVLSAKNLRPIATRHSPFIWRLKCHRTVVNFC